MEIDTAELFREKFIDTFKTLDIDWSLVDIQYISYYDGKMTELPMSLGDYRVRLVISYSDNDVNVLTEDNFLTHKLIHFMIPHKHDDVLVLDLGTSKNIFTKIHDVFLGV